MLWRLAQLIWQLGEAAHRHTVPNLKERAEQRGPPFLEVAVSLEAELVPPGRSTPTKPNSILGVLQTR